MKTTQNVNSCRKHMSARALAMLFALTLAVILTLSSCTGGEGGGGLGGLGNILGGGGKEPVYTGMTIGETPQASAELMPEHVLLALGGYSPTLRAPEETTTHVGPGPGPGHNHEHETGKGPGHVHGDMPGSEADQDDPFDQVESGSNNSDILLEDAKDSLQVQGATKPIYYAQKNQDIYITVHIDNPDSYEILSFTLNGNKYSSYMFEPGSDMENLILKVNVGDVEGVQEYTIDAIKYVDGTDIKDVRMDGDKTVRAGVWTKQQPTPIVKNENIGFNDISFEITMDDTLSLIEKSEGTVMAVIYDGEQVLEMQPITLGQQNAITFGGLTTNALYQYAIIAYYDALDGTGSNVYVLETKAFYTRAILLFDNVKVGTETIEYDLIWAEDAPDKTVTSLVLEHAVVGMVRLDGTTTSISDLLSNNDYVLTASYQNGSNTESIVINFTTAAKTVPTVTVNEVSVSQTEIGFVLNVDDPDGIAQLTKLELISDKTGTVALPLDATSAGGLLSDTEYVIRATYTYDLNDRGGAHELVAETKVKTQAKTLPILTLRNESVGQDLFSFDLTLTDPDGIATLTRIQLQCSKTGEVIELPLDARSVEGLLTGTAYLLEAFYTYDLNDGAGLQETSTKLAINTVPKMVPVVNMTADKITQEDFIIGLSVEDPDAIGTLTRIELLCDKTGSVEFGADAREFGNLLSDTYYTVRAWVSYDLADGNGVQETSYDLKIKTYPKTEPTYKVTEQDKTHNTINVNTSETDPDNVGHITDLSIYLGDELIASSETFDTALFAQLQGNTTYTIVLTYAYDLNNGEGTIQKTVSINVLTKVHFLPIGAEISNTSAVSEGEYVYIDIFLENPNGAVVKFVKINGKTYPIIENMSSNEKVRVGIKHENQFSGGLTDFVVESLTASANGETHEYFLTDNNVATVFINGKLLVESIGVVDGEGTLIDYAFPSDFIGLYVALSNETGYDINSIKIRDYNSNWGYSEYTFTSDQIIMLDQNTALIPLRGNEYRWGGYHDYQVTEITYSNFSITIPKTITVETEKYNVMYFESDEIIEVSTPEDLKNMNTWAYYKLVNDIDLSGIEWKDPQMFRGYFDGGYYTIKNMRVVTTFENQDISIGLFSSVTGKIFNLNMTGIDVNFTASNTLDTWYYVYYGAIAPHTNGRIILDNVRIEQRVAITTRGQHINAYAGALLASQSDNCYVSNSVICVGSVVCNSSTMSNTNLGQSISKLPAKPSFDQDSDPSLYFDCIITEDGVSYLCLSNGIAIVIGFDGSVNDVVIGLDGYKITAIPSRVFYNYDNITSVVIPEGVVTIGHEAFASCDKLASVTLPETLVEIGNSAFRQCQALKELALPSSLRTIGGGAFENCSQLTSIIIPEGVTKIGNYAFQSCWNVTEITLPSTLTTIGCGTFNGTNAKTVFIPISVTTIDNHAFSESTSVYVAAAKAPSGWNQYWNGEKASNVTWGVESIITDASGVKYALMGNKTAHAIGFTGSPSAVVLGVEGYTLTSIAPYAFQNCNTLVSITLPNTVIELGEHAFYNCNILKSVTLSNNLTKISKYAFHDCDALVSIVIPDGIKVIEEEAFYSCGNLTSVTLPGTLTSIERQAFHYCDIRELVIPNSVTKIGEHAFADNYNLTSLTLSSALTSIENYAFAWCEMQNVIIPEGVTSIGEYAFAYCYSIRSVTLPSTLTSIGARAFEGEYLQTVFIPASVTSIGEYAFNSGTIYTCVPEAPTGWNPSWNGNDREEYVVWGVEKYLTDEYGVTYVLFADGTASIAGVSGVVSEIVLGGHPDFPVTEIPANLLNGRYDIKKITIHQSITKIGANAFAGNAGGNWRHIQLPITVEEIDEGAFTGNIVYVSINQKLSGWHENWYGWDSSTVIWDAPAGELYTDEVYGNTYLLAENGWAHLYRYSYWQSELTIAGVEGYKVVVHGGSTNGNWELRKLTLLEGVVELDASAFRYNYSLTEVILPASLEEIGAYAFASTSLEKVVLSDSIKTIGKEAFTSGSIFVICATKPEGWHANWCTANTVWDFKDTYTDENGISYVLTNSGYAYVYNYDREASELIIGAVEGYKVVISANFFSSNSNITKITLEEGVVEVASYAFAYCHNLTLVTLPASLTTMGEHAFDSGVILLKHTSQPAGWHNNWYTDSKNNVIWDFKEFYTNKEQGFTYALTNNGIAYVYSYSGKLANVTIGGIENYSVVVRPFTSDFVSIQKVTLLEGVISIGDYSFAHCINLTEISLPSTLREIGPYAFYDCKGLGTLVLPENLQTIGTYAFQGSYSHIYIPASVTQIGEWAFAQCYPYVEIAAQPENWNGWNGWNTHYAWGVPQGKFYTNENGVTYLLCDEDMTAHLYYYNTDVTELIIEGVENYGVIVYDVYDSGNSSVEKLIISEGVVKINSYAFQDWSKLTEVSLPSTLVEICAYAFRNTPLESLTIPSSVTTIGADAFNCDCIINASVNFKPAGWHTNWYTGDSANVYWNVSEFYTDEENGITYVLHNDGTASVYSFDDSVDSVVLINPKGHILTNIYANVFQNTNLVSITLPDTLTAIGDYAFYGCSSLEEITLPAGLQSIGSHAFYNCQSLAQINLPESLTAIGDYAFYNCDSLTKVVIPEGITKLASYSFYNCNALQNIVLPSTLTEIGEYALAECYALTNLKLPEGLVKIANDAIRNCGSLGIIELPSTLVEIGNYAFGWSGTQAVSIPSSVTTIGYEAFTNGYIYVCAEKRPSGWDSNWNGSDRKDYVKFGFEKFYTNTGITYALFRNGTAQLISWDGEQSELVLGVEGYTLKEIPNGFFSSNNNLISVVIPEGVTKIGESAFGWSYYLQEITLPSTLTYIGENAFYAISPQHITVIPVSVTTIGSNAFSGGMIYTALPEAPEGWHTNWSCGSDIANWNVSGILTDEYGVTYIKYSNEDVVHIVSVNGIVSEIVLGGHPEFPVTEIPAYLLNGRSDITKVTIADGITTIGEYAFNNTYCIVIIPESVTEIGSLALNTCYACIEADEKPEDWADNWHNSNDNSRNTYAYWGFEELYTDENGIIYALTNKGIAYVCGYEAGTTEITIGGLTIDEKTYDVIISGVFQDDLNIEKVTLLDGVIIVDDRAFRCCSNLKELMLPETLTEIGYDAFYECSSLTIVILPDSLQTVEDHAFCHAGCYVYLPATVTTIEVNAFYECYVFTSVSEKQEDWDSGWYGWSNNVIWNAPEGTLCVADDGRIYLLDENGIAHLFFYDQNVTKLTINAIPGYDTVIYGTTDGNGTVEKLTVGEGVIKLAGNAFYAWYNLKEVSLPSALTEIGEYAFYNCDSLKNITIPESVTVIGTRAFYDCDKLTDVRIPATVTTVGEYAFPGNTVYPLANSKPAGWHEYWYSGNSTDVLWNFKEFYTDETNGITYIIHNDNTASVYSFDASSGVTNVVIGLSGDYADYTVIAIYPQVFYYTSITSVVIPEGVVSIGSSAFQECYSLQSVTFPSTLVEIGSYAFYYCHNLQSVDLPDSVTTIGNQAFYNCHNMSLTALPSSLTTIGANAFWNTGSNGLLVIPASVTTIGENAFSRNVIVYAQTKPEGWHNSWLHSDYTAIWNVKEIYEDKTYGVTYALKNDNTAIVISCDNSVYDIVIGVEGYTVTAIAPRAFYECNYVDTITLPDGLVEIGEYAFYNCSDLTIVVLPASLRNIERNAFMYCNKLVEITLPEGIEVIGEGTFRECTRLQSVTLPSTLKEIQAYAFYNCHQLTEIIIPEGVTTIGAYAFYNCHTAEQIVISSTVTTIGERAFAECNYATIIIPDSVTSVGEYAISGKLICAEVSSAPKGWNKKWCGESTSRVIWNFKELRTDSYGVLYAVMNDNTAIVVGYDNSKANVEIGLDDCTVIAIAPRAFYSYNNLTSISLPDSIVSIGEYAFSDCYNLTAITIPEGVSIIKEYTFYGCTNMISVTLPSTLIEIGNYAFYNCGYLSEVVIPEGVTKIGERAFQNCHDVNSLTLPSSLTTIGAYAFASCYNATFIIPDVVTSIGECAIGSKSIYVTLSEAPKTWSNIWCGDYADDVVWNFSQFKTDDQGVTYALLNNGTAIVVSYDGTSETVTLAIDDYLIIGIAPDAFNGNNYLESIIIPETVTTIGEYAFCNCDSLKSVTFMGTALTSINRYMFYDCNSLTEIVIPEGVTEIGEYAFCYCYNLQSVSLPSTLTRIRVQAFYYCHNLTEINIPEGVTEIDSWAFYYCNQIKTYVLPSTLASIGEYAFHANDGTMIIIPQSVTSIGAYGISGTLVCVEAAKAPKTWDKNWYNGSSDRVIWNVTEVITDEYGVSYALCGDNTAVVIDFNGYASEVVLGVQDYTVTKIAPQAFCDCDNLVSVVIPEGVTEIGNSAFENCNSLTSVTLPSTLTKVGDCAFYYCNNMGDIYLPESLTTVGNCAFYIYSWDCNIYVPFAQEDIPTGWDSNWGYTYGQINWDYLAE